MDNKALAEQLVKRCLAKGADAAEVFLQATRNLSIEVRNGEVETVQEAASQGVGFRVFVKGRMAFSNCNDLRDAALDGAIARAVDFARSTTADPNNVLPAAGEATVVEGLYDPAIATVPMERKIQLAIGLEELALQDKRITKSAGASFADWDGEIFLANSNGLSRTARSSACSLGVSVVAEKGEQKSSGGEYCNRRFYADLERPEALAARAIESTCRLLDPRPVKTQRAAVIFDRDVARTVLGGILAAINGETVLQGASFLGALKDKKIASALVTLIDDGTLPRGLGSAPFDGEGVATQKRVIVEKGVLKGFIYNTAAARRAGVASTGNASRNGFDSLPGIGPHNFYMAAGTSKPEEIVAATPRGLWLTDVTGYGINPVNGNFSGGASGVWIENGKPAFPVKGLTVAGTAAEMLEGIDMVGTDLDLARSVTAPMFRIKDMQIGGE